MIDLEQASSLKVESCNFWHVALAETPEDRCLLSRCPVVPNVILRIGYFQFTSDNVCRDYTGQNFFLLYSTASWSITSRQG